MSCYEEMDNGRSRHHALEAEVAEREPSKDKQGTEVWQHVKSPFGELVLSVHKNRRYQEAQSQLR